MAVSLKALQVQATLTSIAKIVVHLQRASTNGDEKFVVHKINGFVHPKIRPAHARKLLQNF